MEERMIEEIGLCRIIREACDLGEKTELHGDVQWDISRLFNQAFQSGYRFVLPFEREKSRLVKAKEHLEGLLLNAEVREDIKRKLSDVDAARTSLLQSVNIFAPFPEKKYIEEYRDQYHQLLQVLVRQVEFFEDFHEQGQPFLEDILNLDIDIDEKSWASLYAPASLDGLLRIYDHVEQYIDQMKVLDEEDDIKELIRSNYQGVIIAKALRHFRWICISGGGIFQAALPAALPISSDGNKKDNVKEILDIPIRNLEEYSSYEGIGELRLFDKITYELERRQFQEGAHYEILIVGDILEKPIEKLSQTVEQYVTYKMHIKPEEQRIKSLDIHMTILTKRKWEHNYKGNKRVKSGITVTYHSEEYTDQLTNRTDLDHWINISDLVFILDSCDLYRGFYVDDVNSENVKQQMANAKDFCIAEEQEMLYCLLSSGCLGRFKKEINQTLMSYITEKLKEHKTEGKSVYVYVSDLEAISGLDYFDEHFIRVERYNEKEFLILRMSYINEGVLPEKRERKIIVLNLWQVIKHSTIRNINCYIDKFAVKDIPTGITAFRNTVIGVEYDEWPQKLKFSYCFPESYPEGINVAEYENEVIRWIKAGIMPYFKTGNKNMFYNYFIKAFGAFLYSDAKCVDDMLFLHLFMNQHDLLKETEFLGECKEISEYRSAQCKYSQKQFYLMAMEDYDTSSEMFPSKYKKLDLMERADLDLRRTIFQKIIDACERNKYETSYLYANCLKMI